MSRGRRLLAALLGLAAALLLALILLPDVPDAFGVGPSGPGGSSYASGPSGEAAYAALLARTGHRVVRRRVPLDALPPVDTRAVLVVLDAPQLPAGEAAAVKTFLEAGGHVLIAGDSSGWLPLTMLDPPRWQPAGKRACRRILVLPESAGVHDVVLAGQGVWARSGATLPFLACDGQVVGTVASPRGSESTGRAVLLSDSGPLQNRFLAARDDAALALDVLDGRRTVVFDEAAHGYTDPSGLAALPGPARVGALGLTLAAGCWVLAGSGAPGPSPAGTAGTGEPPVPPRRRLAELAARRLADAPDDSAPDASAPDDGDTTPGSGRRAGHERGPRGTPGDPLEG